MAFAIAGELAAEPVLRPVDDNYARQLFTQIQVEDRAMGNTWPQGASLLAGAKTVQRMGLIASYRWAFGVQEVIDALIAQGPVVLGIAWHQGMYTTGPGGLVNLAGPVVGGHAIMAHGYDPRHPQFGEVVAWKQSWGPDYGVNGTGYIPVSLLGELLTDQGEACVLTDVPLPDVPRPTVGEPSVGVTSGLTGRT